MDTSEYYSHLITSLHKFRETDFLCDTVLITDDKRELKAHSVVLAAASSVFRTAFASAAERGPGPLQVNLREYESDVVEIALQFIYTGKLLLIPAIFAQKSEWCRLVTVLDRLGLDMQLVDRCEKSFKEYASIILFLWWCVLQTVQVTSVSALSFASSQSTFCPAQKCVQPTEWCFSLRNPSS